MKNTAAAGCEIEAPPATSPWQLLIKARSCRTTIIYSRCSYDLRRASTIYLCPAVRQLDQSIHEIFGSDLIAESPINSLPIQRLLGIPQLTAVHQR